MKKAIKIERKTLKIKRYVGKIDTLWAKNWEEYELKAFYSYVKSYVTSKDLK